MQLGRPAAAAKVAIPKSDMRRSKLIDGVVWGGSNPKAYADSFKLKVCPFVPSPLSPRGRAAPLALVRAGVREMVDEHYPHQKTANLLHDQRAKP